MTSSHCDGRVYRYLRKPPHTCNQRSYMLSWRIDPYQARDRSAVPGLQRGSTAWWWPQPNACRSITQMPP